MENSDFLNEQITDNGTQKIVRMLVVESEQKYKSLVENALVGIYIINAKKILYANPYLLDMIGYTAEELETVSLQDVIAPKSWSSVSDRVRRRLSDRSQIEEYEIQLRHKQGHLIDAHVRGVKCTYLSEPAVLGTLVNITDRLKTMAELLDYRKLLDYAPHAFLSIDSYGMITSVNQKCAELFNLKQWEILGKQLSYFLAGNSTDLAVNGILAKCDSRGEFKGQLSFLTEDKTLPEVKMKAYALRDMDGKFRGVGLYILDSV